MLTEGQRERERERKQIISVSENFAVRREIFFLMLGFITSFLIKKTQMGPVLFLCSFYHGDSFKVAGSLF